MRLFAVLLPVLLLTASLACETATQLLAGTATPPATATPVPTATPHPTATPEPTATPAPPATATPELHVDFNPLSSDTGTDAHDLLLAALNAMDSLDSVHFSLVAELGVESDEFTATFPFRFEGDYQAPDRMKGKGGLSLGFIALEIELINIGQDAYMTDPQTGLWEKTDGNAMGEVGLTQFTGLADNVGSMALTNAGVETLEDGSAVLHLVGLSREVPGGDGPESDLETNIYIGLDDSLIRQVKVVGAIPLDPAAIAATIPGLPIPLGAGSGDGNATISMTTTFSAFNEPVEIKAPALD